MPNNSIIKLLVVDDEADVLTIISKMLQKYDFQVDAFTDPIKALAHFEKHSAEYALVISDVRMPYMTGMEFLNFVKRVRSDIATMVMTAYFTTTSDDEIHQSVPWITKDEIMHKPFRALELCTAVKKTLKIAA